MPIKPQRKIIHENVHELTIPVNVLLNSIPCSAMVLKTKTCEIVAANKYALKAGAVVGKACFQSWQGLSNRCPDCRILNLSQIKKILCQKGAERNGRIYDLYWVPISDGLFLHYAFELTEHIAKGNKLKKIEEQYKYLFCNSLNGIAYCRMIYDGDRPKDFIYISVNEAFENLTGLKNVEGKRVTDVVLGIDKLDMELIEIYGRVAGRGVPETLERYVNSMKMWFSISVYSPERDHFIATFDVISNRKMEEEARKNAEEKLKAIFQILPVGIAVVDQDRKVLESNQAMHNILGMSKDNLAKGVHLRRKYLHSDGRPLPIDDYPLLRALKNDEEVNNFEMGIVKEDGAITWVSTSAVSLKGLGAVIVSSDISKIRNMIKELEIYRDRQELAQQIASAGTWDWDLSTGEQVWSKELFELFGLDHTKDKASLESWKKVLHSEYVHLAGMNFESAFRENAVQEGEFQIINSKKGEMRWMHAIGRMFFDENNRPLRLLGVCVDITERKKSLDEIKEYSVKLEEQRISLEQKNMALKEMLEQIQIEKVRIGEYVERNINDTIMPQLDKLKLRKTSRAHLDLLGNMLKNLTSSFGKRITGPEYKLSPREIEVCSMVKEGLTNKEICRLLSISCQTVEKHRKNIRRKLKISNKGINFQTYLNSL